VAVCAFASGLLSPPNNWDSMTYKLPRIHYWMQHRSLMVFPAHVTRLIELNPGAGFTLLHFELLSGTYKFFYLGQWIAAVAATLASSLIARGLGGNRQTQLFAGALIWSIPMAVLQASSTQDDLTAAAWILVFIAFTFKLLKDKSNPSPGLSFLTGTALGIGLTTKGTVDFFAFPFCLWIGFEALFHFRRRWIPCLAIISICTLALAVPFLVRNNSVFGNPYGGPQRIMITNQRWGLDVLLANTARNIGVNFATSNRRHNSKVFRKTVDVLAPFGITINMEEATFP